MKTDAKLQLRRARIAMPLLLVLAFTAPAIAGGTETPPPEVTVSNVRQVFHNGEHNAFTDLVRFHDHIYLTFRSCPDGHMVHPTASVIVLRSKDARKWKQVHRFSVKDRDTRDPHFLVFKNRLFVYTGTWYSGPQTIPVSQYDLNLHLGYAAWSDDGMHWQSPVLLEGTFGHYIWRASQHEDQAYLCGRRKQDFDVRPRGEGPAVKSMMLESDDGLIWRTKAVFQEERGDETAFLFESNGDLLGVSRRGRDNAQLLRSSPPYQQWKRRDLGTYIGGPLLVKWGDRYVVGGRKTTKNHGSKTALYWLVDNQLREFAELPSGGDCSYPGFLEVRPNRAIVSWYSTHEHDASGQAITAIYMADLELK